MTERNIFDLQRKLRQLHSFEKSQSELRRLIDLEVKAKHPRGAWCIQLLALQKKLHRDQFERVKRSMKRRRRA